MVDIEIIRPFPLGFPKRPDGVHLFLKPNENDALFGSFTWTIDAAHPGALKITSRHNFKIAAVTIPQLADARFKRRRGTVWMNERVATSMLALFQTWDDAGIMHLVESFDGDYVPRFVRGSTTYVSAHAWGTAFDINAAHNPLGVEPPLVGEPGSVRLLVEAAYDLGWAWGGWIDGRPDGMHFQKFSL